MCNSNRELINQNQRQHRYFLSVIKNKQARIKEALIFRAASCAAIDQPQGPFALHVPNYAIAN